ncbi:UNVERIFIED_CONTAM: protein ROLLING AND ERECT LEAF 2 [Sesamum radiatum]|uniref:Protein ROLLING AND ERECT LEAF 2 n=1 Tax=Sesamum radiatum TaxID=300843 RepID=A0AAW2PEX6_SESRA
MEDEVLHQPRKNDQRDREQPQQQPQPPPPPENKGMSSWDYFFSMENVPGPTLAEVDENSVEREEIERKMLEERARRKEMEGKSEKAEPVAEAVETVSELPPQPPPPEAVMAPPKVVKRVKQGAPPEGKKKSGVNNVNLVQIFVELDDCFLKASESAHEVSRMLEAIRLHYHSNFADKKGNINHSERVMRVITWNRSFRGLANADDGVDDFDSEEHETHATVLDKMLAWEKKLYDEVKAGEQMKLEYQRKVASLNKLKKRGSNTEALERMKAAVSHLHTRYIVDMQSMDSTVSEINRLRDEQLYPNLLLLWMAFAVVYMVNGLNGEHHQFALSWQKNDKRKQVLHIGDIKIPIQTCRYFAVPVLGENCIRMATMWETMRIHHENQSKIVQALRLLDISQAPKETSDHHHERTRQLGGVVQEWYTNFSELMSQQKEYIKALNSWLKLNLIPIDTNWKEKVSSPGRPQNPPIQLLLHAWHDYLEKLPDEPAKASINNFAAIIKTIWQYQKEELDFRNRCADSRKDLIRKTRDFENWYNKYMQKRTPPDDMDPDRTHDKDLIAEKQLMVEAAKQKLEEDEEAYQRQVHPASPLRTQSPQPQPPQYVIVLPPYPPPHRHRLFRKSWQRCLFCFATFLLFLIAAAYLLWPSDPELSIVRVRLERIRFHMRPKISLDITMDLTVRVRNQDFYELDYDSLLVAIGYRGKRLGYVTSDGGHIKARGSSYVNATLQLDRVEILSDVVLLIEDLAKGEVTFDTESEITGKLGVVVFDLPLKTKVKCEVIVNTKDKTVSRQSCYPERASVLLDTSS